MSHTETADVSRYTYRVTWSVEDNEFVATCAEFPSLSWLADSQPAAQPQPVRRATPLRSLLGHL